MDKTIQIIICFIGVFIMAEFDGVYDAFGVYLMIWANNLDYTKD